MVTKVLLSSFFLYYFNGYVFSFIFIGVGRHLKYKTKEEKQVAQRKWAMEYYWRNTEKCKNKRMKKYYETQQNQKRTQRNKGMDLLSIRRGTDIY